MFLGDLKYDIKPLGEPPRDADRAHPDLNQGPADLQSAALTTELCTQMAGATLCFIAK